MVNVLQVFAAMDREMARRGFNLESERYDAESFGHRTHSYRRNQKSAASLLWDARDEWFILQGGIPWRDLAYYKEARTSDASPEHVVAVLLQGSDAAL